MKKLWFILIILLFASITSASPFMRSDKSTDLGVGAVFQLMINGIEQSAIYPTIDNAVELDVQSFEGTKEIKVRFGNPWPELENTYKWSEWSEPLVYTFPTKPTAPAGCSIKK